MLDILNKIRNKFFPSKISKFLRGLIGVYQRWEDRMFQILSPLPPFAKGGVIKVPFIKGGEVLSVSDGKASGGIWFRIAMYLIGGLIIGSVIFFTGDFVTATMIKMNNNPISERVLLTTGLVGHWELNGSTGATDLTANGNNGVGQGAIDIGKAIDHNGQINGATTFASSTSDYISIADNAVLRPYASDWSVSVWAKLPNYNQSVSIVSKWVSFSPFSQYGLSVNDGTSNGGNGKKLSFNFFGDAAHRKGKTTTADVVDGNWHLYTAVVIRGSDIKLYVDGVEKTSSFISGFNSGWPDSIDTTGFPVSIGAVAGAPGYNVKGSMSDVRIYNRALSVEEVKALYNRGGVKLGSATTQSRADSFQAKKGVNLIRYFKMDMTSSTAVKDFSEYATDGIISGATASRAGKIGAGMSYDGTSDWVRTDADVIDETADFSVAAWVNLTSTAAGATRTVFGNSNGSSSGLGGIYIYNGLTADNFLHLISNNDVAVVADKTLVVPPLPLLSWTHVAVTYVKTVGVSEGVLTLYVNGSSVGSLTGVNGYVKTNALNSYFGAESNGGNSFLGLIDEARIYNKALSQNEILDLYNLPNNLTTGSLSKGLVGRWELSKDSLQTSTRFGDSTPYNKTGISANVLSAGNFAADNFKKSTGAMTFVENNHDYVAVGNTGKTTKAVSFWVYIDPAVYPNFGNITWTEVYPPGGAPANKNWTTVASDADGSNLIVSNSIRLYTGRLIGDVNDLTNVNYTWTPQYPEGGVVDLTWRGVGSNFDGSRVITGRYTTPDVNNLYVGVSGDGGINYTWTEQSLPAGNGTWGTSWDSTVSNTTGSQFFATGSWNGKYVGTLAGDPANINNITYTWVLAYPIDRGQAVASDATGQYLVYGGGGNSAQPFYTSANYGSTWTQRSFTGGSSGLWNTVNSSSDGSHLITGDVGGNRLFTSTNYGSTWTQRYPAGGTLAKPWAIVSSDADGSNLIAGVGSASNGRLYTSMDFGNNWIEQLPAGDFDKNWLAADFSDTGSRVVAANSGGRLYVGTQTLVNEDIMEFGGGNSVSIVNGVVTTSGAGLTGAKITIDGQDNAAFGSTGWHQVIINLPTGLAISDLNIGKVGAGYFSGRMSDVRIYDRSLTPSDGITIPCGNYFVQGRGLDTLTYGTVLGGDGRCWLDRNLGAPAVATAYNDSANYGWYYQWGRPTDGHQISNSDLQAGPVASVTPGTDTFITSNTDWSNIDTNGAIRQANWGVNGASNPCPVGWRVPTRTEWITFATASGLVTAQCTPYCHLTAFNSVLKLTLAGWRRETDGGISFPGGWSQIASNSIRSLGWIYSPTFAPTIADTSNYAFYAYGVPVRCIKN